MNSKEKIYKQIRVVNRDITSLVELLGKIDENNPDNDSSEYIVSDDGETVNLSYDNKTKDISITNKNLKLRLEHKGPNEIVKLICKK